MLLFSALMVVAVYASIVSAMAGWTFGARLGDERGMIGWTLGGLALAGGALFATGAIT